MSRPIASGSGFERLALCPTSAALPHSHHETEWTQRGTVIHEFLENCSKVGRDQALDLVDIEYRPTCEQLNLEGLHDQLGLAAEVAIAYDVDKDTARELGRGEGRKYDDVTESELPATLDVVGVRRVASGNRGLVVDWKSGFTTRRRVADVQQLDVGALCVSRAYDCDVVEVQLVHVHEDLEPWVQRRVIEGWEMDAFAFTVSQVYAEARKQREQIKTGLMPRDFNTGPWCVQCPAREFCPAQTTLLRSVLSGDLFDGPRRMQPIPDEVLIDLWGQLGEAYSVLSMLKGRVLAIASQRTLYLGRTPDGKMDRWLGRRTYRGKEMLDGEATFDVIAELYGDDVATAATKVVATKKDMEKAVKKAAGKGKGAKALVSVYDLLRKRGGLKGGEWKTGAPTEYVTKVQIEGAPATPELPAGDPVAEEIMADYYDEEEKSA